MAAYHPSHSSKLFLMDMGTLPTTPPRLRGFLLITLTQTLAEKKERARAAELQLAEAARRAARSAERRAVRAAVDAAAAAAAAGDSKSLDRLAEGARALGLGPCLHACMHTRSVEGSLQEGSLQEGSPSLRVGQWHSNGRPACA